LHQQRVTLGIHRSDYMLDDKNHTNTFNIQQVELNTIAVGLSNLGSLVPKLHKCDIERKSSNSKELTLALFFFCCQVSSRTNWSSIVQFEKFGGELGH
jgi:hypothetical protein